MTLRDCLLRVALVTLIHALAPSTIDYYIRILLYRHCEHRQFIVLQFLYPHLFAKYNNDEISVLL